MIRTRLSILSLSVAASLLCVTPVRGEDVEEAKRHFEKAETAYKMGDFQVALRKYEAAYKAWTNPAFLFNMAQAHRQQYALDKKPSHLHRALTLYKTYLREAPKPQNKETVKRIINELKQILAALEARANEPLRGDGKLVIHGQIAAGASITLDGKPWGTVPRTAEIKPGVHQLEIHKPGFAPWSTTVQVEAGTKVDIPVMLQAEGGAGGGAAGSTPVYKKWWFWAVVVGGAAAVTGTTLGIYYGTREEDLPDHPYIDLRN